MLKGGTGHLHGIFVPLFNWLRSIQLFQFLCIQTNLQTYYWCAVTDNSLVHTVPHQGRASISPEGPIENTTLSFAAREGYEGHGLPKRCSKWSSWFSLNGSRWTKSTKREKQFLDCGKKAWSFGDCEIPPKTSWLQSDYLPRLKFTISMYASANHDAICKNAKYCTCKGEGETQRVSWATEQLHLLEKISCRSTIFFRTVGP